ncbi:hypothetical protein [Flavobacterium sp.]|uniref:hypothetical protein n=1 Tax=Flavobacterium sp. TaxID=239 RepID=UPI003D6A191B
MAIKYYYIDDDPLSTIQETAKGLSVNPENLEIIPFQHKKWEEIIEFLSVNQTNYDGLLIDWGLNRKNTDGDIAGFDVEALTQQLRRLSVDRKLKDFPIILCSAQFNFSKTYDKLLSSHDLFDVIYEKDFFHENRINVINEMVDLAKSYKVVNEIIIQEDTETILKSLLKIDDLAHVDYRVVEYLTSFVNEKKPVHEISRFILTKIIRPSGLLIDKYLLASRLGIDISNVDDPEIIKLLGILNCCSYEGVFSSYFDRWWMELLSEWWNENFDLPLGSLSASERVERINKNFTLSLKPAEKLQESKSDYFWTICKVLHTPIALADGILAIVPIDQSPWEEDEYYSISAALELETSKVHPLERERLKKLKDLYTKVRKR